MPIDLGERNEKLCQMYTSGSSAIECGVVFKLSRARVHQILRQYGIPVIRSVDPNASRRDTYLGVNVASTTKASLKAEATARDISVSALVDEKLGADKAK